MDGKSTGQVAVRPEVQNCDRSEKEGTPSWEEMTESGPGEKRTGGGLQQRTELRRSKMQQDKTKVDQQ
ncbi:hypothetical protein NDU88_000426 [Pleurodeles waltl]|uniref:Uncharacterized protein n=1 Tax=Pleurodeles waltl TaxID=8319 RepID=A0AAV7KM46_PLEWA|nr:hypothetical protein NDU88_000426 [Pleurodeles waltl]